MEILKLSAGTFSEIEQKDGTYILLFNDAKSMQPTEVLRITKFAGKRKISKIEISLPSKDKSLKNTFYFTRHHFLMGQCEINSDDFEFINFAEYHTKQKLHLYHFLKDIFHHFIRPALKKPKKVE